MLNVSNHREVLGNVLDRLSNFDFTEDWIKDIHKNLMADEQSWEVDFKPELIGEYRNIPTVGHRLPFFEDKEYAPHYNLEMVTASHMHFFNRKFDEINDAHSATHLITALAYFHNLFLNKIHPFADGNGRVCRIVMCAVMMQHSCPPIFPHILEEEHRFEYISTIIECERQASDEPLIRFLAVGMTKALKERLQ